MMGPGCRFLGPFLSLKSGTNPHHHTNTRRGLLNRSSWNMHWSAGSSNKPELGGDGIDALYVRHLSEYIISECMIHHGSSSKHIMQNTSFWGVKGSSNTKHGKLSVFRWLKGDAGMPTRKHVEHPVRVVNTECSTIRVNQHLL